MLVIIGKFIKTIIDQNEKMFDLIQKLDIDMAFIFDAELRNNLKRYNAAKMKGYTAVKNENGDFVLKKIDEEY